jgi:diaminopimelate epimerase
MNIPFIKIQNAGNDYIYIDKESLSRKRITKPSLAKKICDRHFGVGADGIFVVDKRSSGSAYVQMFNSDGSSMEFCGNGTRGAALYLREKFKSRAKSFYIGTSENEYEVRIIEIFGPGQNSRLKIGNPSFDPAVIGLAKKLKNSLGIELKGALKNRTSYCVAMPNPHAVIFVEDFDFDWRKEGAAIEKTPYFKNKINVMFTRVDSKTRLTVNPGAGAGATLSCGSGRGGGRNFSLLGYVKGLVSVCMPGGVLKTSWDISENTVCQEGPSRIVCAGSYRI